MSIKRAFRVAPLAIMSAAAGCSGVDEPQPAREQTAAASSELRGTTVNADSANAYAHVGTFQAPYRTYPGIGDPIPATGLVAGVGVMLSCNSVLTSAETPAMLAWQRTHGD